MAPEWHQSQQSGFIVLVLKLFGLAGSIHAQHHHAKQQTTGSMQCARIPHAADCDILQCKCMYQCHMTL